MEGKYSSRREVKRPGSTEDAYMEVACSISNPDEIKHTLGDGSEKNTKSSVQQQ